jgi:competence protein ComEC
MEREGVLAAMPGATFLTEEPPAAWSAAAMAWRVRGAVTAGIRARLPEPEATVLLGEVVGIRGKLPAAVEADLVDSGLVHVLAVSGLKVAVVAGILTSLLRRAGRRAALAAILGIFVYAGVGGGSSAALRSALMGTLALVAQVLRRDPEPVRSLLLAGSVMLGLNPALAGDLSFQYSFLGVAGIQLLGPALAARIHPVPRPFQEALSVSIAAQAATLPLTAAYFHVVPLAGPAVNGLVVPFLGPAMLAGGWVAAGLPGAGGVVLDLAAGSTHALLLLAHVASSLPAGVLRLPWFGLPEVVAYYVAAITWLVSRRLRR